MSLNSISSIACLIHCLMAVPVVCRKPPALNQELQIVAGQNMLQLEKQIIDSNLAGDRSFDAMSVVREIKIISKWAIEIFGVSRKSSS